MQLSTELRFQRYKCQIYGTKMGEGFKFVRTSISETKFCLGLEESGTEFKSAIGGYVSVQVNEILRSNLVELSEFLVPFTI